MIKALKHLAVLVVVAQGAKLTEQVLQGRRKGARLRVQAKWCQGLRGLSSWRTMADFAVAEIRGRF